MTSKTPAPRRQSPIWSVLLATLLLSSHSVWADTTPQTLPFSQDWSDAALITTDDSWSGVPGIVGYRGDSLASTGADPQTVVADGSSTPVDVNANETNPDTLTTGGVAEFDTLGDPTVALQGSGTADAPHLVLHLDTTGDGDIVVSYNVRDIEGSSTDAVQQVALQYRVGSAGDFTNLAAGYVADATTANSATQVTPVSVMLPAAVEDQSEVQIRILTANASGSDEWVGIDDLSVTAGGVAQAMAQRLLLSEVVVTPTGGEYIEIHNPNGFGVDLSNVYLTDATFPGSPGDFYYNLPTGANAGGGTSADFHARFPDGASIAAGETQTVSLAGSGSYFAEYGFDPTYELFEDGARGVGDGVPEMREALAGSIGDQGGLSNGGEVVILHFWDGATDLVTDLDYVLWGDGAEAVDKSGVMIDGPDADGTASSYQGDVATGSQEVISSSSHPSGGSFSRLDPSEGREVQGGSNGVSGSSETSEDVSTTWTVAATATPGSFDASPLVINELHADPDSMSGDANGDGSADPQDDEFIELVNTTGATFDLSGFVLSDSNSDRHLFPSTLLPAGCAVVVFGGGSLTGPFGSAQAVAASTGALGLNNDGDTVRLENGGFILAEVVYGSEGGNDQSLTRDPDLTGGFVEHSTATGAAGALFSPGTLVDGSDFAVDCTVASTALEIFEIQGDGAASPFDGMNVTTEDNIVTAVVGNGFYLQTPDARSDGDAATSDGIFVFTNAAPTVAVGDQVDVTGTVVEFFDFTELDDGGLSITIDSMGNPLPTAVDLDTATPAAGPSDPPDLERFEGMLVRLENFFAVGGSNSFGDVPVAATAGHKFRQTGIAFPGLMGLPVWDGNQEVFELNPDGAGLPDVDINFGDQILLAEGALGFSFGDYQLQPTTLTLGPMSNVLGPVSARAMGEMTIGSLNVQRLFDDVDDPSDTNSQGETRDDAVQSTLDYDTQRIKLARYIVDVLDAPDVLAIQEIESLGVLQDLAAEITLLDPTVSYSAALEEGNDIGTIDVGYLFRGNISVSQVTQLGKTETFVFDAATDLTHDRPPLLLEATFTGNGSPFAFAAMVLHNRSLSRIDDPADGPRVRQKRLEQAQSIAAMVQDFQTNNPTVPLVVLGDMNAYEFTDGYVDVVGQMAGNVTPADNLLSGPDLVDPNLLIETKMIDASERYSFIFGGAAAALDHALTSTAADPFVRGLEYGRGNTDASQTFSTDASTPLASSDHDGFVLFLITDQDGDGAADDLDNCPEDTNADQADGDGDLVGDVCDNCPMDANADQFDADMDGLGDRCDSDHLIFADGFESGSVSAWSSSTAP